MHCQLSSWARCRWGGSNPPQWEKGFSLFHTNSKTFSFSGGGGIFIDPIFFLLLPYLFISGCFVPFGTLFRNCQKICLHIKKKCFLLHIWAFLDILALLVHVFPQISYIFGDRTALWGWPCCFFFTNKFFPPPKFSIFFCVCFWMFQAILNTFWTLVQKLFFCNIFFLFLTVPFFWHFFF